METNEIYVSSLAKGATSDRKPTVVAQGKINGSIANLHKIIDSYEDKETVQDYSSLDYDGIITATPFTIKRKPSRPIQLSATIGSYTLWIGTLYENGYYDISIPNMSSSNSYSETTITKSIDYTNDWCTWTWDEYPKPDPDNPGIWKDPLETFGELQLPKDEPKNYRINLTDGLVDFEDYWEQDGVKYTKKGRRQDYIIIYMTEWDTIKPQEQWWHGIQTQYRYEEYILTADFSSANMHIHQKYLTQA